MTLPTLYGTQSIQRRYASFSIINIAVKIEITLENLLKPFQPSSTCSQAHLKDLRVLITVKWLWWGNFDEFKYCGHYWGKEKGEREILGPTKHPEAIQLSTSGGPAPLVFLRISRDFWSSLINIKHICFLRHKLALELACKRLKLVSKSDNFHV